MSPKTCHDQVELLKPGGRLLLRRYKMFFSLFLTASLLCADLPAFCEGPDYGQIQADVTTEISVSDSIQSIIITADKGVIVSRVDTLPLQASSTVSDLLHQSPGLYVGDYGGPAGLKTVSLRGLGSSHTSVYVDGVRVGNVQSGQCDLGTLGLDNFSAAVVDYAQNSLYFTTARPVFRGRASHRDCVSHLSAAPDLCPVSVTARFQAGSFNTYMPYLRADFRLNDLLALSANAAGVFSRVRAGFINRREPTVITAEITAARTTECQIAETRRFSFSCPYAVAVSIEKPCIMACIAPTTIHRIQSPAPTAASACGPTPLPMIAASVIV
mgnify:CR=1 FL=1